MIINLQSSSSMCSVDTLGGNIISFIDVFGNEYIEKSMILLDELTDITTCEFKVTYQNQTNVMLQHINDKFALSVSYALNDGDINVNYSALSLDSSHAETILIVNFSFILPITDIENPFDEYSINGAPLKSGAMLNVDNVQIASVKSGRGIDINTNGFNAVSVKTTNSQFALTFTANLCDEQNNLSIQIIPV